MNDSEDTMGQYKIRLVIDEKEDQPVYEYFTKIKAKLGIKANTEVVRYCIVKTFETEFKE